MQVFDPSKPPVLVDPDEETPGSPFNPDQPPKLVDPEEITGAPFDPNQPPVEISEEAANRINLRSGFRVDESADIVPPTRVQLEAQKAGAPAAGELGEIAQVVQYAHDDLERALSNRDALEESRGKMDPIEFQQRANQFAKEIKDAQAAIISGNKKLRLGYKGRVLTGDQEAKMLEAVRSFNASNPTYAFPPEMHIYSPSSRMEKLGSYRKSEIVYLPKEDDGFQHLRNRLDTRDKYFQHYLKHFETAESDPTYWGERIPFVGGLVAIAEAMSIADAAELLEQIPPEGFEDSAEAEAIRNNPNDPRHEAVVKYNAAIFKLTRMLAQAEKNQHKGELEMAGDILTMMPGYVAEFVLTGGAYTGARTALTRAAALKLKKMGVEKATRKALMSGKGWSAAGVAGKGGKVGSFVAAAGTQTLLNPQLVARNLGEERKQDINVIQNERTGNLEVHLDPWNLPEDMATAYMHSVAELGSERMGEVMVGALRASKMADRYRKIRGIKPGSPITGFSKWANEYGWHGPIPELLEERINELATYGYDSVISGKEDLSWDAFDRRFTDPLEKQFHAEVIAFSAFSPVMKGYSHVAGAEAIRKDKEDLGRLLNAFDRKRYDAEEASVFMANDPALHELNDYEGAVLIYQNPDGSHSYVKAGAEPDKGVITSTRVAMINSSPHLGFRGAFWIKGGTASPVIEATWSDENGVQKHTFKGASEAHEYAGELSKVGNEAAAEEVKRQIYSQLSVPYELTEEEWMDRARVGKAKVSASYVRQILGGTVEEHDTGYLVTMENGSKVSVNFEAVEPDLDDPGTVNNLISSGLASGAIEQADVDAAGADASKLRALAETVDTRKVAGVFVSAENPISINGEQVDVDWLIKLDLMANDATFRHETLHLFRETRVITDKEYRRIADEVASKKNLIELAEAEKSGDQYRIKEADTKVEEEVAEYIESMTGKVHPAESFVIRKALDMLDRLRHLFRGLNARGLYKSIESGRMARREPAAREASEARFSVHRNAVLKEAARAMREGAISKHDYRELIHSLDPIVPRESPPAVPSDDLMRQYLSGSKRQAMIGNILDSIPEGESLDVRIDIGSYVNSLKDVEAGKLKEPVVVVTAHKTKDFSKGKAYKPGKPLGYAGIVRLKGWAYTKQDEDYAQKIAEGAPKNTISAISGQFSHDQSIPEGIMEWDQVGYDPIRSSQFYDKRTGVAVKGMLDPVIVGTTVFAKEIVHDPAGGKFSIQSPPEGFKSLRDWNQFLEEHLNTFGEPVPSHTSGQLQGKNLDVLDAMNSIAESARNREVGEAARTMAKMVAMQPGPIASYDAQPKSKKDPLGHYLILPNEATSFFEHGSTPEDLVAIHEVVHSTTSRILHQYTRDADFQARFRRGRGDKFLSRLKGLRDQIRSGKRKVQNATGGLTEERINPSGKDLAVANLIDLYLHALDKMGPAELTSWSVKKHESFTFVPDAHEKGAYRVFITWARNETEASQMSRLRKWLRKHNIEFKSATRDSVQIRKEDADKVRESIASDENRGMLLDKIEFILFTDRKKRKQGFAGHADKVNKNLGHAHYGWSDLHEFTAEAMSNPAFQHQLMQIDMGSQAPGKWHGPRGEWRKRMAKSARGLLASHADLQELDLQKAKGRYVAIEDSIERRQDSWRLDKVEKGALDSSKFTMLDAVAYAVADMTYTEKPSDVSMSWHSRRNPRYPVYSVQANAEYMEAAESGNLEKAQGMVDQAAKAAGYDDWYHGTQSKRDFTVFNDSPVWLTPSKKDAEGIGRVLDLYVKRDPQAQLKEDFPVNEAGDRLSSAELSEWISENRSDLIKKGIKWADDQESFMGWMVVIDPNIIKSADPITRDDAGNIIPLAERFQPSSDDIRYSVQGGGFKVQQREVGADGQMVWVDAPWMVDEQPMRFKSRAEAQAEIDELIKDTAEAGMKDYSAEDYRIIEDSEMSGSFSVQGEQFVSNVPGTYRSNTYSRLANVIRDMDMERGTVQQWVGRLKSLAKAGDTPPSKFRLGQSEGVHREEVEEFFEASNLSDKPENAVLTKEDLLEHVTYPEVEFLIQGSAALAGTEYEGWKLSDFDNAKTSNFEQRKKLLKPGHKYIPNPARCGGSAAPNKRNAGASRSRSVLDSAG